jgi:hypothetical protein
VTREELKALPLDAESLYGPGQLPEELESCRLREGAPPTAANDAGTSDVVEGFVEMAEIIGIIR